MRFGFAPRIAVFVAVILIAGVALTVTLSIHKFQRTSADLIASRFEFVVVDIRQKIHTQLDLGLPFTELQDVSDEFETYMQNDRQILSIELFDDAGTVLYSTDPSFIGDLVSEDWVALWRTNQQNNSWTTLERDAAVVGVPLRNNLDQDIGSLVLRYSREFLDLTIDEQIERLSTIGTTIALIMTLVSLLGCSLLLRKSSRDLKNMNDAFSDAAVRKKDSESIQTARSNHPEFAAFLDTAIRVQDDLEQATIEVHHLDEYFETDAADEQAPGDAETKTNPV